MERQNERQIIREQPCYLNAIPMDVKIEILVHLFARQDIPFLNKIQATGMVWPFLCCSRTSYFSDVFNEQLVKRITKIYKVLPEVIWLNLPTPVSKKYFRNIRTNVFDTLIAARDVAFYGIPAQIRMLLDLYPPHENQIINNLVLELASSDVEAKRLRLLLSKGIDVNAVDPKDGDTALHKVVRSCNKDNVVIKQAQLKVLLDYSINVGQENNNNFTAYELTALAAGSFLLHDDLDQAKRDWKTEKLVKSQVEKWHHFK